MEEKMDTQGQLPQPEQPCSSSSISFTRQTEWVCWEWKDYVITKLRDGSEAEWDLKQLILEMERKLKSEVERRIKAEVELEIVKLNGSGRICSTGNEETNQRKRGKDGSNEKKEKGKLETTVVDDLFKLLTDKKASNKLRRRLSSMPQESIQKGKNIVK